MRSKTKFMIDDATIMSLFKSADIHDVTGIEPLGAGEYNSVFAVHAGGTNYVLKIAPHESIPILSYEKDMMKSEVFWYRIIKENTEITVPKIYFIDFSRSIIPVDWFIMSQIPGIQLDKMEFAGKGKNQVHEMLAEMAASIHKIENEQFGYIQNGLHKNWHSALRAMVQALIDDCSRKGRRSERGKKLLGYIDKYREVLNKAECCMVNFDIWEPNIICNQTEEGALSLGWIDPERSFWGDRIADFVCLEALTPFKEKKISIEAYNRIAETQVLVSDDERIRFAAAQGYLGLIMETEKYYRYTPFHFGWWRNVFASSLLYRKAFETLKAYSEV